MKRSIRTVLVLTGCALASVASAAEPGYDEAFTKEDLAKVATPQYSPYAGRQYPTRGLRARLSRPLDFLVISDHAEMYGLMPQLLSGDPEILATEKGRKWHDALKSGDYDKAFATAMLFNVGVEIGQVAFVVLIVLLERSFRTLEIHWPRWVEALPGYAVGSLGAYWTIQRIAVLLGGTR